MGSLPASVGLHVSGQGTLPTLKGHTADPSERPGGYRAHTAPPNKDHDIAADRRCGLRGKQKVKLLLVDDHVMLTDSLGQYLGADPFIDLVGAVGTASDAFEQVRAHQPDVVLMDYHLPDMDGVAATRLVKRDHPRTNVIMLTGTDRPGVYGLAIEAGVSAWVRKTGAIHALRDAVHCVHRGDLVTNDELAGLPSLDQLVVQYQPIVELSDDRIVGFEALVRWAHPTRGIIGPAEFIPRAEAVGFIHQIGEWVGREATQQLAVWQRQAVRGPRLWISINLPARGFEGAGVIDEIADAIAQAGINAGDVVLEITEQLVVEDAQATLAILTGLQDVGIRLSLDDFGSGFSSLSYLRQFPFDHVKLDRSFIDQLPGSPRSTQLVRSMAELASTLGLGVIAEGIERPEQARLLKAMGVRYGQGYLYSRPVDAVACGAMLADRT